MYINSYQCCGRLVENPMLFSYQGSPGINFTLALNKPGSNKPIYIKCVAWGRLASSIAEYYHKGSALFISGELDVKSYVDKDGITRKDMTVKVEKYSGMGSSKEIYLRKPVPPPPPKDILKIPQKRE